MGRMNIALLAALLAGGCVVDTRKADTVIGAPRVIDLPLAEGVAVDVRIPAGQLEIRGVAGDRLHAELLLKCADEDGRCARRLGKVQLLSQVEGDRVTLRLSHNRSFRYREGNVYATIEVPRGRDLAINMTAGELHVSDIDACLSVDMGAGDVDIQAAADTARRVFLDAGVGDAELTVGAHRYEASRSWLIGAELSWEEGIGRCDLAVDLQAGDINVSLY